MEKILNISQIAILLITFSFLLSACTSSHEITSITPKSKIIIDGEPDEWENQLSYIENEKCAVGFKNDSNYIYLCFETSDNNKILKILSMGLTVWLEPDDGKILGINFPQRADRDDMRMRQPGAQLNPNTDDSENMSRRIKELLLKQPDLQIINEDEFPLYAYPINDPYGFQISLGYSLGRLVYELRIPYGSNNLAPVIINAYPGEILKLKFETGKFNIAAQAERGAMHMGGGGGVPGGGRGGMKPGSKGMADLSDQFELELSIVLVK